MKAISLITLYPALKKLSEMDYANYAKSLEIYKALLAVKESHDWLSSEEMKAVTKYALKKPDGSPDITPQGYINFADDKSRVEYIGLAETLRDTDVLEDIGIIKICGEDFAGSVPSPALMNELSALIEFI